MLNFGHFRLIHYSKSPRLIITIMARFNLAKIEFMRVTELARIKIKIEMNSELAKYLRS